MFSNKQLLDCSSVELSKNRGTTVLTFGTTVDDQAIIRITPLSTSQPGELRFNVSIIKEDRFINRARGQVTIVNGVPTSNLDDPLEDGFTPSLPEYFLCLQAFIFAHQVATILTTEDADILADIILSSFWGANDFDQLAQLIRQSFFIDEGVDLINILQSHAFTPLDG